MKYLAVIPARKASKGLKNKNIYPLLGKPLIEWTIRAAVDSKLCDIVVSTDSKEITELVGHPVRIIERPDFLAEDSTPLSPVIAHACRQTEGYYDAVITLQPTSPLRKDIDIIHAVSRFEI